MPTKIVTLSDNSLFEFMPEQTGWSEAYYRHFNTGDETGVPVFTASPQPVAFVSKIAGNLTDDSKQIDATAENPLLSFASNGDSSAGRNFIIHDRPFYISNDRTVIRIKAPDIDSRFIRYQLRSMKADYGFCFAYKATERNLQNVSIEIPVLQSGQYDLSKQIDTIMRYDRICDFQMRAKEYVSTLDGLTIALPDMLKGKRTEVVQVSNTEYFQLQIGDRVLAKDLLPSGVPVYSANIDTVFGYTAASNLIGFDRPSLIWGIDGIFDWGYREEQQPFSITDHCGRLMVVSNLLEPRYVYYALRNTKGQYRFDRTYRASLKNMRAVVTIEVPVGEDGYFDLDSQRAIAKRYDKIELMKKRITEELNHVSDMVINIV